MIDFTVRPIGRSGTVGDRTLQAGIKAIWATWSAQKVHHRTVTDVFATSVADEALLVPDTSRAFDEPTFAFEYKNGPVTGGAVSLGASVLDEARTAEEACATSGG